MDERTPSHRLWRRRGDSPALAPAELHAVALSMAVARRALRGTLPADFIHDPALEMLLALYLALPRPIASGELADQTTVSRIVAQHWIAALTAEGLLAAAGDMVALSEAGVAAMEAMLAAVVASQRDLMGWGSH